MDIIQRREFHGNDVRCTIEIINSRMQNVRIDLGKVAGNHQSGYLPPVVTDFQRGIGDSDQPDQKKNEYPEFNFA